MALHADQSPSMSNAAAVRLKPLLDRFAEQAPYRERIPFDPVEFPHRYRDPRDIEVSGLLSASLAYGRADLFRPKLDLLFSRIGSSPANFAAELSPGSAKELLGDFVYRFNVGTDLAVLLLGMGRALRELGSLEAVFVGQLKQHGDLRGALSGFTAWLRKVPIRSVRRELGPERGLHHLLPSPLGPGAAKRLNLFLRWMVRGPDQVDFGIWSLVPKSLLIIPLDTHVGRLARHLRLTQRKDLSWRTAEEITASLRRIDAADPTRYDFALCHYGMSGGCPLIPRAENCGHCSLQLGCRTGQRIIRRSAIRQALSA